MITQLKLTFSEGTEEVDKNRKNKKADGKKYPLELQKIFFQKIQTGAIFLFAYSGNHAWHKPIFYWLHACCYLGVDLGKRLYHYFLSRLTDGTPHSFSDLLYFTPLLPFTWTIYFKSNFLSRFDFGHKIFRLQFLFPLLLGQTPS